MKVMKTWSFWKRNGTSEKRGTVESYTVEKAAKQVAVGKRLKRIGTLASGAIIFNTEYGTETISIKEVK